MIESVEIESAERFESEDNIVLQFRLSRSEKASSDKLLTQVRTWQKRANERFANGKLQLSLREPKRSKDANSYMWVLLDKIAKVTESTRENIYREIVKSVGKWDDVKLKKDAVETFVNAWNSNGIGYQVDIRETSDNYTILRCYYGTSSYAKDEFSRLLEEVVIEAKGVGIDTRTPDEIADMIDSYYKNFKE